MADGTDVQAMSIQSGSAAGPRRSVALALKLALSAGSLGLLAQEASPPAEALVPRTADYTLMWWAEGFPGHTPGAPWRRVIQTGTYAFALDSDSLRIPQLGAVTNGLDYVTAARAGDRLWESAPPADLELSITANEQTYRCISGGKWTEFAGPRLVESGRFLQRADVTDLAFRSADGVTLNAEARFETVAWPDRLALILAVRPKERWTNATMHIVLRTTHRTLRETRSLPTGQPWAAGDWREVFLAFDPATLRSAEPNSAVQVEASELPAYRRRPVTYDPARGWHQLDLNGIEPALPPSGGAARANDAIERVKLRLHNPTGHEQTARLLFEKTGPGFRQRVGSPITGMSAVLRHPDGQPTGIPVQLSKNWHNRPEGGVYAGAWFHGFSQVRLPPSAALELELAIVYGHWGGVAAASHAQLCLIGWGSNQQWDESALGAWGESICYEPDQVQAQASILDVRPLMVRSMAGDQPWQWTHNVGGGDYFRLFDVAGRRVPHTSMRTAYERQGPCLTEVIYAGRIGEGLAHNATMSLARTDDVVRGLYRLRLDVRQPTEFSRFVIFQIGADTYSYTGERKMALGNESGLIREWATQWGGGVYRTEALECLGRVPWVSLHEAVSRAAQEARARGQAGAPGAWANRGLVIRAWQARLGGQPARPWVREFGVKARGTDTSTLDLVPPPGVTKLLPGDFVEAIIEHLVVPQFAADYYGPNEALRTALLEDQNTWRMIHREAVGNDRRVEVNVGTLEGAHPSVHVRASGDRASFTVTRGLGYLPVTISDLAAPLGYVLRFDDQIVDQSVHGQDFWQTDYDATTRRWSRTYNLPIRDEKPHRIELRREP
jgi:hypothetical protein